MNENANVQNADEVVDDLRTTIKSSRALGCEEDRKAISKSELKKDKNISIYDL